MHRKSHEDDWLSSAALGPAFDDVTSGVRVTAKQPAAIVKETRQIVEMARAFTEEIILPNAGLLDIRLTENPDYLPWWFVEKANEWGFI